MTKQKRKWETKCDKNPAATLVLEAPDIMKRNEIEWFHMMIYDVLETSDGRALGRIDKTLNS